MNAIEIEEAASALAGQLLTLLSFRSRSRAFGSTKTTASGAR